MKLGFVPLLQARKQDQPVAVELPQLQEGCGDVLWVLILESRLIPRLVRHT